MKLEVEMNQIKQGLKTHFELIEKPTAKEHLLLEPVTSTEQVKSENEFFIQLKNRIK
jgi:hypothetical protein